MNIISKIGKYSFEKCLLQIRVHISVLVLEGICGFLGIFCEMQVQQLEKQNLQGMQLSVEMAEYRKFF
jgi:hypothetical protein